MGDKRPLLRIPRSEASRFPFAIPKKPKRHACISDGAGHSNKLWMLIGYLLFSGRDQVPAEDLIEILWPGDDTPADPMNSLRLLVHRARVHAGQIGLLYGVRTHSQWERAYSWNKNCDEGGCRTL